MSDKRCQFCGAPLPLLMQKTAKYHLSCAPVARKIASIQKETKKEKTK